MTLTLRDALLGPNPGSLTVNEASAKTANSLSPE